jgi:hypothetical protein
MSDISLTNLDGVLTAVVMWLLAALYAVLALGFCVVGLRTGRDKLWGHRMIFGFGLAGALWLGSFQLRHLPGSLRRALDETYLVWILPAFLLGVWACFKVGRRGSPAKPTSS